MARTAKDGTEFTNQRMVNAHNARLDAGTIKPLASAKAGPKAAPTPTTDDTADDQNQQGEKNILDDPKAMSLVDQLQQMGYTAEDVDEAFQSESSEQQPSDGSDEASQAASLNIPGMK